MTAFDPGRIEAVCFDLDDTLFEFTQYVRAGLLEAADLVADHTGRRIHDELLSLYFDDGVTDGTFDRLVARHDLPRSIVPDLVEAYHGHRGPLDPYPEAEAVLDRLGRRYALGVLTDGRNGRGKLDLLGLADRFDAVVVAHGSDFAKPEAAAFERVAGRLGVDPGAVVHVGDDPERDLLGANRAGMWTVRLRRGRYADEPARGEAAPDVEIADLDELVSVLAADRSSTPAEDR